MAATETSNARVDFLCIGAQRSGTTWLTRNLQACPEVWLPPIKELHYFSRSKTYNSPSLLCCRGLPEKLVGASSEARSWRSFVHRYSHNLIFRTPWSLKPMSARWGLRYFFGVPNDDWYVDLFKEGAGKIKGECTPAYSLLESADVARVAELFPDLKVILLMRDPVDRVLSQLRLHLDGLVAPILDKPDESAMLAFATAEAQLARGDYVRIVDTWLQHFPASHLHTTFYEDLCENPDRVVEEISRFLGVSSNKTRSSRVTSDPANVAGKYHFSSDLTARIADAHQPIVEACASRFGGRALVWGKTSS